MAKKTQEQRQLEVRVRRRREFVIKVVAFVEKFVIEKGTIVLREESSDHTHVVRGLLNFRDFSFYFECGETYCGGNDVRVWHHPGKEMVPQGVSRFNYPTVDLVLDVYYQGAFCDFADKSDEVKLFAKSEVWQSAIRYLMKNKDRVLAAQERDKKRKEAAAQTLRNAEADRMRLVEQAVQLHV